tara:strand:- start:1917 stop:3407 length:1491 start_codon:yes stop_codon:yes gene_type:complete
MSLLVNLKYLSATELISLIKNKDISPVELIEHTIKLIEERNPSLNALIYLGFDDARKEAKKAEQLVMKKDVLGPLHGVPIGIKDLFDFKPGWITTFGGVRAFKKNISNNYCVFAERIEKSGGIIIGKTNSPVMGFRGTCDNYLFGPTRNPFNTNKNSGGSSGGSAAAVADGMLPIAEGTDAGGSIRIPSAWCGVYGLKPSFGLIPYISRPNAFSAGTPFVSEGPITRTVDDAALALSALSGYDTRDPNSIRCKNNFVDRISNPNIKNWKIAYSPNFGVFPVEKEIIDVVEKGLKYFEDAGATVEKLNVGIKYNQNELSDLWCRLIMPGCLSFHNNMKKNGLDLLEEHKDDFPQEYHYWLNKYSKMKVVDHYKDQEMRTEIYDNIQTILDEYNLLITPTLACMPVNNKNNGNTVGPTEINGEIIDPLIGWCLTYLINFTGHPAASIPAGLSKNNLPIGMQIIGRRFEDSDVLIASKIFETLNPWKDTYKICENRKLN